jgi:glycosyltransferase involved in cell wall biosynthesis
VKNSRPAILFIVHPWGGGTIRFARELAELISDRVDVVWAWGDENKSFHISKRGPYFAEQSFDLVAGLDAPLQALNAFKVSRVNIIHTIGLERYIVALAERFTLPYDVTITDYHHFSTRPHFEDDGGWFMGDAVVAAIARTMRNSISPLLRRAERRIAVSGDLARRIGQFLPGFPVIPVRIFEAGATTDTPVKIVPLADGEVMRVLVLGRPRLEKGLSTIVAIAQRAERENLPIEIISLGESSPEVAALVGSLPRVRALGAYAQKELATIIARLKTHLAWFPFTQPETHSYALSDAASLGLPILASGIGAAPERLVGRQSTWVVPFNGAETDADSHFQWLKRLYLDRMETPARWEAVDFLPPVVERFYPDGYLEPLSILHRSPLYLSLRRLLH